MKKIIVCTLGLTALVFLNGCASAWPSANTGGVNGVVYANVTGPLWVSPNAGGSKVGSASAESILGIVGTGDASVQAAASKAGITKVNHVDQNYQHFLGIWAEYTVTVYGE